MRKTLFSLSGLVAAGYFLVLFNQVIISREMGTTLQLDAFFYALSMVGLFWFFAAPINEAAIPQFFIEKEKGDKPASRYFSQVINTILLFSTLGFLGLTLVFPWILTHWPSLAPRQNIEEVLSFTRWLSPMILLGTLNVFFASVLNSLNKYLFQNIGKLIGSLLGIVILIALIKSWGIYSIITSTLLSLFIVCVLQYWDIRRSNIRYTPALELVANPKFYKVVGVLFFTYFLSASFLIFQNWGLAQFGEGYISAFNYAQKVFTVPQQILLTGLVNLSWTRAMEKTNRIGIAAGIEDLLEIAGLSFAFSLFAAMMLNAYSDPILYLLYFRGQFNAQSFEQTTLIFKILILTLPFLVAYNILSRIIITLQQAKSLGVIGVMQVFICSVGIGVGVAFQNLPFAITANAVSFLAVLIYSLYKIHAIIPLRATSLPSKNGSLALILYALGTYPLHWWIKNWIPLDSKEMVFGKLALIAILFCSPLILLVKKNSIAKKPK